MKISAINTLPRSINFGEKQNKQETSEPSTGKRALPPSDCCRAFFAFPVVDNFKKVGETTIKDRTTGNEIKAEIKKKEVTKDFSNYRLYADDKEVGFMDLALDEPCHAYDKSISPEENEIPFERFPKVVHLRTLSGDKYSGIGTALIKHAVEESKKSGTRGALWLDSKKGYMKAMSRYRSDENPVPFYYKLGFRAPGKAGEEIESALATKEYDKLPVSQLLYLSPEAADKL